MRLLITDLDNTLYDWVTFFALSFTAMVDELVPILNIERELLLDQFQCVHRYYSNSEQPFAILDLPIVRVKFAGLSTEEVLGHLDPALHAFNRSRDRHLRLYPGVRSTLDELKNRGITIVGHTESVAVNAYFRLRKLDILGFFQRLYALEGNRQPHPVPGREELLNPPEHFVELLPYQERKPNPALLLDICRRQGVPAEEAVYVGDSLTRDMSMAKNAGLRAVWAEYGTNYDRALWSRLVRVTHWSDDDVAREAQLREIYKDVRPDMTIGSFAEILPLFDC